VSSWGLNWATRPRACPLPSMCVSIAGSPLSASRKCVLELRIGARPALPSVCAKLVNVEQTHRSPRPILAVGRDVCGSETGPRGRWGARAGHARRRLRSPQRRPPHQPRTSIPRAIRRRSLRPHPQRRQPFTPADDFGALGGNAATKGDCWHLNGKARPPGPERSASMDATIIGIGGSLLSAG